MQLPWEKRQSPSLKRLAEYRLGDIEGLQRMSEVLNPPPHWSKNMVFCSIVGVALISAGSGAYLAYREPNNEKTLQTAGLLLTGSLTGLIGIVAGSKI
jgi:hypothetical protein